MEWSTPVGVRRGIPLLMLLVLALGVSDAQARRRRGRSGFGTLEINSMTSGADVLIDGQPVGKTPLGKTLRLPVGKHTLKMTLQGYTEYLDVFTITRGKTTSLDVDLLPYAGVLQVTVNVRDARVFFDGEFVGTAPVEKEVLIGKRRLRVRKAGYYEYIGSVECIAGKAQRVHVELKAMPVGSTPYRPPPPPPAKWYEKWYVWAGGATAVAAITVAIVVPVVMVKNKKNEFGDFCDGADLCIQR